MKRILLLITVAFVLFGCNSVYKENLEAGENALEDGDFQNALIYYNTALEEKPDDSEIKNIITLLNDYEALQQNITDFKWQDAFDLANAMLKSDAMNSFLEKEVIESFAMIEDEQEKEEVILKDFKVIEKLISNEDIKKANSKLDELEGKIQSSKFNKKLDGLYIELEKTEKHIAEEKAEKQAKEKRLKEEEQANKAELKNDYLAKFDKFEQQAQADIEISYSEDDTGSFTITVDLIHEKANQWDSYMNDVYQILSEDMSDSEFSDLKENQKSWLENKSDLLDDASMGGTAAYEGKAWIEYDETRDRCYYLVKNHF